MSTLYTRSSVQEEVELVRLTFKTGCVSFREMALLADYMMVDLLLTLLVIIRGVVGNILIISFIGQSH